jgi:DNA polymerase-4
MKINQNNIQNENLKSTIMYVDMNCFFPSCEQQVNYWLRNRPIGVCVYTSKYAAVIALSKEAKRMKIKPARIDEIMKICPEFVPLETNPRRYREFHHKIMTVLRTFCDDVIPKSIDEAVLNFSNYGLVHKDLKKVAVEIKNKIKNDVGDWFTCSIGIAPNAFLAKLASDIKKPDGLTEINPETIDGVLDKLSLTDLPGISKNMAGRLIMSGIHSPLQMRHSTPADLRRACHSIIGEHWYYRLNFKEVDITTDNYKSMQAMRQISKEQRASINTLHDILRALCLQLEQRMVKHGLAAGFFGFSCSYEGGYNWADQVHTDTPVQDGIEMMNIIEGRMVNFEKENDSGPIINHDVVRMTVWVSSFVDSEMIQYSLFESNVRNNTVRKTIYSIKNKFGFEKIQRAAEITETPVLKDVIGFGSIKDITG